MRHDRHGRAPRAKVRAHPNHDRLDAGVESFCNTVETALVRLATLQQQAAETRSDVQSVLPVAIQELQIAIEELEVADEQLRQQNEELIQARLMGEGERQRYQELLDFAPDAYLVTDAAALIREANHAAAELLAVAVRHLRGKPLILFVEPAEHRAFRAYLTRLIQQAGKHTMETRLRPRRRNPLDAEVTTAVVQSKPGTPTTLRWVLRDVSARKVAQQHARQAEQALQASRAQLRALATHLQNQQEEERRRIAREIHDELGQALTVLNIDLAWLSKHLQPATPTARQRLYDMGLRLDGVVSSVRRIGTELRPSILDELGLMAAIEWQLQEVKKRTGLAYELTLPEEDIALDQTCATGMFRIFQEALTNVLRHAMAQCVAVRLAQEPDALVLEIADDGQGITPAQLADRQSLGLLSMRERALLLGGSVTIGGESGAVPQGVHDVSSADHPWESDSRGR
jgi:PAS domain S-box-containing protein